ncbi:MAG: hypothetical protein QOG34_590 [Frankiaceae bacterium]|nr:hypothetical protein [Frankiaceae bacterium]
MARIDLADMPRRDQAFLGLGVLILILSFLPWYGGDVSANILGTHVSRAWSTNAWHGWAALGLILMLIATAIVATELLSETKLPELRVSWAIVVFALDVVGGLLLVIKSFNLPSASGTGFSVGLRWAGWLLVIAAIAQVVVAALRFRASGETMPWAARDAEAAPE